MNVEKEGIIDEGEISSEFLSPRSAVPGTQLPPWMGGTFWVLFLYFYYTCPEQHNIASGFEKIHMNAIIL